MNGQFQKFKVVISTPGFKIKASLVVPEGLRLSDYLNDRSKIFVSLVEVKIFDWKGEFLEDTDFLGLNKERIIWIREDTGKELF